MRRHYTACAQIPISSHTRSCSFLLRPHNHLYPTNGYFNSTIVPETQVSQSAEKIAQMLSNPTAFNFSVFLRRESADTIHSPEAAEETDPAEGLDFIGCCGGMRTPEFGYMIDEPYWGKGYATEAMRAVLDAYWAFFPDGMPGVGEKSSDIAGNETVPSSGAIVDKGTGDVHLAEGNKGEEDIKHYAFAVIEHENVASKAVVKKLGFEFWKQEEVKEEVKGSEVLIRLDFYRGWRPGWKK